MRTVHSYARFSDKKQQAGDSETRQNTNAEAWVKKMGYRFSDLRFWDKGKSGFKGDKQKSLTLFLKALEDGRVKKGDILLVESVDRLSRKGIRATQNLINQILTAGVDIAILTPVEKVYIAADDNDFGGTIELAAFAYQAYCYSKQLSDRVSGFHRSALKKAVENKTPINSGTPPMWLTRIKGKFKVKPEARKTIQYIFAETIRGSGGKTVLRGLQAKFKTFARASVWNETYIQQILKDRRVLGEFSTPKTEQPIIDYYPKIIDEKTWLDAQQARRNRFIERGPSGDWVNLFTGLVWHAKDQCRATIYSYHQKRKDGRKIIFRRLKSTNCQMSVKGASTATVCATMFEKSMLHFIWNDLDGSIFDNAPSLKLELKSKIYSKEQKQKRLAELQEEVEEGDIKLLLPAMKKIQTQIVEIEKEIEQLKLDNLKNDGQHLANLKRFEKVELTNENRQKLREAIKRVIKQITILPVKIGPQRKDKVVCFVEVEYFSGDYKTMLFSDGAVISPILKKDKGRLADRTDLGKALDWLKQSPAWELVK